MMRQVVQFLIVLALASLAAWYNIERVQQVEIGTDLDFRTKYKMWFEACDYTRYSCLALKPPRILLRPLRRGLLGVYRGGETIEINKSLRGIEKESTILHEMIHYLQVKRGGLRVPGRAEPICKAEEEAFTITDKWLRDRGYADKARGPDWWRPYRHCYKWYGPKSWKEDEGWYWFDKD